MSKVLQPENLCDDCPSLNGTFGERGNFYKCNRLKQEIYPGPTHCFHYEGTRFPVDVAIITAVDAESQAVRKYLGVDNWETSPSTRDGYWYLATYEDETKNSKVRIALAEARQMGLSAAAIEATKACYLFHPRYLFMVGITAGRKDKTRIGDVVVPTSVWDYGAGKWIGEDFLPNFQQVATSDIVRHRTRVIKNDDEWASATRMAAAEAGIKIPQHPPKVVEGPFVSGAAVVDSKEIWDHILKQNRKTLAIDMEAYAVALAGHNCLGTKGPEVIIAKSVCDFAIGKNDDGREYAAFTSVSFMKEYLRRFILGEDSGKAPVFTAPPIR